MEPNVAYNVVHANNRRERETQATALQENIAYNVNQRSPTETDNEYSTGYITYDTAGNTKSTGECFGQHKNEYGKKRFAILVIIAFILSLLVTVAALVYANIELKNQLNNQSNLGTINNPASSCSDIPQDRPSGEYWIAPDNRSRVRGYCDMNRTSCSCNTTTGGWMRVANLDMTDLNQNCPEGLRLVTREEPPLRTCGRMERRCTSTTYSTYGVEYSNVCGRIIAYQDSTPDAFDPYFDNRALSIDDGYVDGVSLTHGQSPRQHIWTFAGALDETRSDRSVCPCTRPDLLYTGVVPPFIGQDYFCETGSRQAFRHDTFYPDDPLWDGQGCRGTSTCCEFNNPPWFCKQLPQPTTDNIELRLCFDQDIDDEDTPIEIAEIYIR